MRPASYALPCHSLLFSATFGQKEVDNTRLVEMEFKGFPFSSEGHTLRERKFDLQELLYRDVKLIYL